MKLLDMNFSQEEDPGIYNESQEGSEELSGNYTNLCSLLYFFVDNAITSQEPVDPKTLAEQLPPELQSIMETIITSDPSSQDKAIVTALISKYKNLDSDPRDIAEFKEHTKNLVEANSFGYGTCNYYVTRVCSGDVMGKKQSLQQDPNNMPPTDAEMQQQQQAEQGQPQGDPNAQQGPPPQGGNPNQGQPQQGQYSNMSPTVYDEWDNLYNDIQYTTEEDIKNILQKDDNFSDGVERAKNFILKKREEALEEAFADLEEEEKGVDLAIEFLVRKQFSK